MEQMQTVSFAFSSSLERHNDTSKWEQLCNTHYFKTSQVKTGRKNASHVIQIMNILRKRQHHGTNVNCTMCRLHFRAVWNATIIRVNEYSYASNTILKHFRLKTGRKNASHVIQIMNRLRKPTSWNKCKLCRLHFQAVWNATMIRVNENG